MLVQVGLHIVPKIKDCKLLHNIPDNVSDHVALSMTLELETKILGIVIVKIHEDSWHSHR